MLKQYILAQHLLIFSIGQKENWRCMTGVREETNKKGSTVPTADYIGHGRELAVLLSINHANE